MSKKNIEVTDGNEELQEVTQEATDTQNVEETTEDTEMVGAEPSARPNEEDTEGLIIDLEGKVAKANEQYLRVLAEFDNFRKRSIRERSELVKTASKDVIKDLLPVLDDFERAFKSDPDNEANSGFQLIYNKFKTTLESQGLKPMETVGEEFDTEFHDALTKIPAPSKDLKGKVVDEIEKGYFLKGTIIRHAKVVVGK